VPIRSGTTGLSRKAPIEVLTIIWKRAGPRGESTWIQGGVQVNGSPKKKTGKAPHQVVHHTQAGHLIAMNIGRDHNRRTRMWRGQRDGVEQLP